MLLLFLLRKYLYTFSSYSNINDLLTKDNKIQDLS